MLRTGNTETVRSHGIDNRTSKNPVFSRVRVLMPERLSTNFLRLRTVFPGGTKQKKKQKMELRFLFFFYSNLGCIILHSRARGGSLHTCILVLKQNHSITFTGGGTRYTKGGSKALGLEETRVDRLEGTASLTIIKKRISTVPIN